MATPLRSDHRPLTLSLFALLLVESALATVLAWPTPAKARETVTALGSTTQFVETLQGREEFRLEQYLNERDEKEIAVIHEEARRFFDTEAVVIVGRDLDRDGKFDAWFVLGKGGVLDAVDRVAQEGDGWDVVFPLLRKHTSALKNRWLIQALFHWVNGFAGFAGREYFDQVDRTQMNLHSAEIRADRLARTQKRHPMLGAYYQQISLEWTRLGEETESKLTSTIAWDSALTVGPFYAGKAIAAVLARLGIDLAGSPVAVYFRNIYDAYVKAIFQKTKSAGKRVLVKTVGHKMQTRFATATGPFRLAAARASTRVDQLLDIMEAHDKISRAIAHGFKNAMELGRAGLSNKGYIAQTQAVQLAAEVWSRPEDLFDPSPIVMARKIRSDKDLLQNMGFMTTETFLLAGMSKLQPNIPKRLAICAVLAIGNTASMSYLVKGETDVDRIKFDAGWEAIIGNLQTLLDTTAIGYSAHFAEKTGNAKLKFIGFAFALVDQTTGYFFYAKKTNEMNNAKQVPPSPVGVRLVPIYAPN